jgi:competence protein ComEA
MKRFMVSLFLLLTLTGFAYAAVDLNTASKAELQTVKGIGPGRAEAIIEYRKTKGPFAKVDDLKKVKGFGAKTVAKLRPELSVKATPKAKMAGKANSK